MQDRNAEVDFHGQKRSNATHASTTDPDARLYRKGSGKEAKLCSLGHVLMENRHGLVVDARLTLATGTAEREAAVAMIGARAGAHRITLGGDKNNDTKGFAREAAAASGQHRDPQPRRAALMAPSAVSQSRSALIVRLRMRDWSPYCANRSHARVQGAIPRLEGLSCFFMSSIPTPPSR